jgi:hypothetical protein
MIAVALAAVLAATSTWAQRLIQYDTALRDYSASTRWYGEGRLLPVILVLRSQRLMEAQLALAAGRRQQIRAITAHLARVSEVIQAEINAPLEIHSRPDWDSRDIEEALRQGFLPLDRWLTAVEVKNGLAKCQDQLKTLSERR